MRWKYDMASRSVASGIDRNWISIYTRKDYGMAFSVVIRGMWLKVLLSLNGLN